MADKPSTHRGNRFYTLASVYCGTKVKQDGASSFFRMRRAEAAIAAVVRAASDPKIVGFPARRAFQSRKKATS